VAELLLVKPPDDYYGGLFGFDLDTWLPAVQRSRKLLFDLLDDFARQSVPAEQSRSPVFRRAA